MHRVTSKRGVAGVIALAIALGSAASAGPARAATTSVPGIDVSKWQNVIDWHKVAGAGIRFAVVRATRGQSYQDPTFDANVAGASAQGIVVGAYHRATTSGSLGDARIEADHFLAVAAPHAGQLIPALDIEEANGLTPSKLVAWVKAWVTRVRNVLGVRPMIYSSPHFWTTYMGNSTWFADHGYPLWIAHWDAVTPSVPADDWQGRGWLFWQYKVTGGGSVPGVTTSIDRDKLQGANLGIGRIARVQVQTGAGGAVSDASGRLACGGGATCEALFDPRASVSLTATPGTDAVFLSWSGACGGGDPVCTLTALNTKRATATFGYPLAVAETGNGAGTVTSTPAGVKCPDTCIVPFPAGSAVTLHATPDTASEFDGWSGGCTGTNDCTVTMDGLRTVAVTFADLAPPSAIITPPIALNGPVRVTFSEPVRNVTRRNLVLRRQSVAIDAALVCRDTESDRVSCADGDVVSATLRPRDPLVAGQSYVASIDPAGVAPVVDRAHLPVPAGEVPFRAATTLDQAAPGIAFAWGVRQDPRVTGGSYTADHRAGASVTFGFDGPSVALRTVVGPAFGTARVAIDGRFRATIDGYATRFGTKDRTWRHLGRRGHTLTVTATGGAAAKAAGSRVGVDALVVGTRTYAAPKQRSAMWGEVTAPDASEGSYAVADVAGAWTSVRFRGVGVTLSTRVGPAFGRAQLWVDGKLVRSLDLSSTTGKVVPRAVTGLGDRVHTVRLVVVGRAGASGSGAAVAVDGWTVT